MKMFGYASLAVFVLMAHLASAADLLTGKWSGQPADAPRALVFDFKVTGEEITGTLTFGDDHDPIQKGILKGADVTFEVHPDNAYVITFKGKIEGDVMKLHLTFSNGIPENDTTFHRVKQ